MARHTRAQADIDPPALGDGMRGTQSLRTFDVLMDVVAGKLRIALQPANEGAPNPPINYLELEVGDIKRAIDGE